VTTQLQLVVVNDVVETARYACNWTVCTELLMHPLLTYILPFLPI